MELHHNKRRQIRQRRGVKMVVATFHWQLGVVVRRTMLGKIVAVMEPEVLGKARFGGLRFVDLEVLPQYWQPRQFFLYLPRHEGAKAE